MRRLLPLLALLLIAAPAAQAADTFEVGTAKTLANPPAGQMLCIGGYDFCEEGGGGRTMQPTPATATTPAYPDGIADDSYARALAVGDGKNGMILVHTTNIGLFVSYKTPGLGIYHLRQKVAEQTGVAADHVIVQADHSHHGPDTIGIWGGVPPEYLAKLQNAAIDAAVRAWKARKPARVYVGTADGPGVTSSYNTPPNVGTDDEFRLLWANDRTTGDRIATFSNYSPHATSRKKQNVLSGDWPEWASTMAEARYGGGGIAGVGTLGREDFGDEVGPPRREKSEAVARARIDRLMTAATAAGAEVPPTRGVAVKTVFIREPLAQPILAANFAPETPVAIAGMNVSIDRDIAPPWNVPGSLGTYTGAARIGDVFFGMSPGEPFPQIQFYLREQQGIKGARTIFHLGAVGDFLGYMVYPVGDYPQVFQEGAGYLAGCPEEAVLGGLGVPIDEACPDHWTLMVGPGIGTHVACTIQAAGGALGFEVGPTDDACPAATASDGVAPPA
ncbi:MAG: hypothetical protein H0V29_04540, partial [Thermoleophilaceae bacterium]|nr:hypothetical protein [Thermoleophilaceae bacterium]